MTYQPSMLPEQLRIGIVHLGLGAFHRAHQADYTEDAILVAGGHWGICAVAMRSRQLAQAMREQGGKYSLIEQQSDGPVLRERSVIREILCLPDEPEAVLQRLADPEVHVVTVTVTEKGYCFAGADRHLNIEDVGIVHDIANPSQPQTLPGILAAGLLHRRTTGGSGLTIISCDNLPSNGRLLKHIVHEYASSIEPALAAWISDTCRFPDSMIDRITPATTDNTLVLATRLLGKPDPAAVETEPFRQWVIEDDFAGPHPAWDQAGAQLVAEVAPFEAMKLRMLNGSHSLIAYLGAVAGLPAVRDVMAVPACRALIERHMTLASETLEQIGKQDLLRYREQLLARFANPSIDHRCLQIAMDGSQKLPQRIFIPAMIRMERVLDVQTFALATALWFRYLTGENEQGAVIECNDPLAADLKSIVDGAGSVAERVVALGRLPGLSDPLFEKCDWVSSVAELVDKLDTEGVMDTVSTLVEHEQSR